MKMPAIEKLSSIWKPHTWLSKYKYKLLEDWSYKTDIAGYSIRSKYVNITKTGILKFKKGYTWDGASGPTWDTKSCRRGALVHDGLYQLLRTGKLPQTYKKAADQLLYDLCVEDGMWKFRARYWLKGVEWFGFNSCKPEVLS